jgi:hypothetical protein
MMANGITRRLLKSFIAGLFAGSFTLAAGQSENVTLTAASVVSVDAITNTIIVDDGMSEFDTLAVTDSTVMEPKGATLADLKVNEKVLFSYKIQNGKMIASHVVVSPNQSPNSLISTSTGPENNAVVLKPKIERWPHKGCFNPEMAFQYGNDLAGVKKFIQAENNYLQSLHLMVQTKNASGSIISTQPINNYNYGDDFMVLGARALYFLGNNTGLGMHCFFINYSQELNDTGSATSGGSSGEGDIVDLYFFGPSITQFLYHKGRFGISLKCDAGVAIGKIASLPALDALRHTGALDGISGLNAQIQAKHAISNLTGMQANVAVSANWLIARWFSLDAGLSFYLFYANLSKQIWPNTPTSISSVTAAPYVGVNLYLFNHQPD